MKNMLNTLLSSGLPEPRSFRARVGLSISLFAFAFVTRAQNLVPNWSFEDTAYCGIPVTSQILRSPPWFSANNATPDVYSMDANSPCGIFMDPNDFLGESCFQAPFDGLRFAGQYFWKDGGGPLKEYMEVELLAPLIAGHSYRVAMELSLPECYEYALDRFGAYFSEDTVFDSTLPVPGALQVSPQAEFHEPSFFSDTIAWMHVEDTILATGNERFMVIGSFIDNDVANVQFMGTFWPTNGGYYYLDALVVEDVTISEGITTMQLYHLDKGLWVIWPGHTIDEITVRDMSGRMVGHQTAGKNSATPGVLFNLSPTPGMYVISVVSDGKQAIGKWMSMQ